MVVPMIVAPLVPFSENLRLPASVIPRGGATSTASAPCADTTVAEFLRIRQRGDFRVHRLVARDYLIFGKPIANKRPALRADLGQSIALRESFEKRAGQRLRLGDDDRAAGLL